jgi:hypothetical protein
MRFDRLRRSCKRPRAKRLGLMAMLVFPVLAVAAPASAERPSSDPAPFEPHTPQEVRSECPEIGTLYASTTSTSYNLARNRVKVRLKTFSVEACDRYGKRKIAVFMEVKEGKHGQFHKIGDAIRWKTNKEAVLHGAFRAPLPRCSPNTRPLLMRRASRVSWLPKSGRKSEDNSKLYIGKAKHAPC